MSELTLRIFSALIAAPVFLFVTWIGGWYFIIMLIALAIFIQMEIIYMLNRQDLAVNKPMTILMGIPILLIPVGSPLLWPLFLFLLIMAWISVTLHSNGDCCKQFMATLLAGVAIPALLSGLLILRNFGEEETGFALTVALLLLVWTNDTFAFIGGKLMGKRPLAPAISPNKTIEGFLWGFFGCFLALGIVMIVLKAFPLNLMLSIPFAILVGLFGPAGDLAESKLKRVCNIKNSSGLMPGHGGMYDRFDAILFAAPVVAFYVQMLKYFNYM